MIAGGDIVAEARTFVGTPYRHQGRLKGVALDCVGLIIEVGLATGGLNMTPEAFAPLWAPFRGYGRLPNPARVHRALQVFLRPLANDAPQVGDVCYLKWDRGPPMHLGILAAADHRPTLIHAHGLVGRCVEHGFTHEWPDRAVSWWRYPLVGDK